MRLWSDETACRLGPIGKKSANKGHGHKTLSGLARMTVVCGAALLALSAQANLVTPISVSLLAPGGITGDTTPVAATGSVSYGAPILTDATQPVTDIRFWLLNNSAASAEQISLNGDSIQIRAAQGVDNGTTGYLGLGGQHARYEFTGLAKTGFTITGFTVSSFDGFGISGFNGLASGLGVSFIDTNADLAPDKLIFNLDDLVFVDRLGGNSLNFADFRISILSIADIVPPPPPPPNGVPEPGTVALFAGALFALRFAMRQRAGSPAFKSSAANV